MEKKRYTTWFPVKNPLYAIAELIKTGGLTITYEIQTSDESMARKTNYSRVRKTKSKSKRRG